MATLVIPNISYPHKITHWQPFTDKTPLWKSELGMRLKHAPRTTETEKENIRRKEEQLHPDRIALFPRLHSTAPRVTLCPYDFSSGRDSQGGHPVLSALQGTSQEAHCPLASLESLGESAGIQPCRLRMEKRVWLTTTSAQISVDLILTCHSTGARGSAHLQLNQTPKKFSHRQMMCLIARFNVSWK